MKKADVKIGGEYYAKVTNKKVVVRIDAENRSGGWDATNLSTNKKIRIKTAQRLQGVARKRSDTTKTTTDGNVTVVESPRATTETFTNKRARKRVDKTAAGAKAKKAESAEKKLSCVAAALKVLGESSEPMNTKEMIDAMVDGRLLGKPRRQDTARDVVFGDPPRHEEGRRKPLRQNRTRPLHGSSVGRTRTMFICDVREVTDLADGEIAHAGTRHGLRAAIELTADDFEAGFVEYVVRRGDAIFARTTTGEEFAVTGQNAHILVPLGF